MPKFNIQGDFISGSQEPFGENIKIKLWQYYISKLRNCALIFSVFSHFRFIPEADAKFVIFDITLCILL